MSEFTLEDGRKAEKVENNPDNLTKVIEVYVEPKFQKRLSQRITEKFCVCEREIETINEDTGEVVSKVVEKLCGPSELVSVSSSEKSTFKKLVEEKVKKGSFRGMVIFGALLLVQLAALAYVVLFM